MPTYALTYGADITAYADVNFESESDRHAIETAEMLWETRDQGVHENVINLVPCFENEYRNPRVVMLNRVNDEGVVERNVMTDHSLDRAEDLPDLLGTDRERELYDALQSLYESLDDVGDTTNPETGEPYDDCRRACEVLVKHQELRDTKLHPSIKANMAESDRL